MSIQRALFCCVLMVFLLSSCRQDTQNVSERLSPNVDSVMATMPFKERRVAIVYSETSAKYHIDEFAYGQLYSTMQYQAMQAGVPYDLLNEIELIDATTVAKYDVLIIPLMSHIKSSIRRQVFEAILAAQQNGTAIVTSSEFMTHDEDDQAFANSNLVMIELLGLRPGANQSGVLAHLKILHNDHPITATYQSNEFIHDYLVPSFVEFTAIDANQATTLVGGGDKQRQAALQVLERPGRVVHFANYDFLANNNLLWRAIRWAIYGDKAPISLLPTRASSLFLARNDIDQALLAPEFDGNEIPLLELVKSLSRDYNFVGSYYLGTGHDVLQWPDSVWSSSKAFISEILALGNEIGAHISVFPHDVGKLSDSELQNTTNQSRQEVITQFGFDFIGSAVSVDQENLEVVENFDQWFEYFSGQPLIVGQGYQSAFGFLQPNHEARFLSQNMSPHAILRDYSGNAQSQAGRYWEDEFDSLISNAGVPVMHWLWSENGPTSAAQKNSYSESMIDYAVEYAFNSGAEFTTIADYNARLNALESASFSTGVNGDISARVDGAGLGQFALKLGEGQEIANVANWYAYNNDVVFIPENGGEFSITPGYQKVDVTRIIDLPMRARLESVHGNGNEIYFSFTGQGDVVVEISETMQNNYMVTGSDSYTATGNKLVLNFEAQGAYSASITPANPTNAAPVSITETVTTSYATPIDVVLPKADEKQAALSFSLVSIPSNGVLTGTTPNLVYTPNNGFSGIDTFTFAANDNALVSVVFSVTVQAPLDVDNSPIIDESVYNIVTGHSLNIDLSVVGNDGADSQYSNVSRPLNGTISGEVPNLTYQSFDGFTGQDEFTFLVNAGGQQSVVEQVIINVTDEADLTNRRISNVAVGSFSIDARLNEWATFSSFGIDPQDVAVENGLDLKQAWMAHDEDTFFIALEYYNNTNYNWRGQIFIDSDTERQTGFSGLSNEYPIGADYLIEGRSVLKYAGTGADWKWVLQSTIEGVVDGKRVELAVPRYHLENGSALNLFFSDINVDGSVDYYPDDVLSNYALHSTRRFSYTVGSRSNENPIVPEMLAASVAPVAASITINTIENVEVPIDLSEYAINDHELSFEFSSQPAHGVLTGTAPIVKYKPELGFIGSDSFTFAVNEGTSTRDLALVKIVVSPDSLESNTPPVADSQSVVTEMETGISITLTGSDANADILTFRINQLPAAGTLSGIEPDLFYLPDPTATGIDSFTYVANDGLIDGGIATVSIEIKPQEVAKKDSNTISLEVQSESHESNIDSFCRADNQNEIISDLWQESSEFLHTVANNVGNDSKSLYNLQTYTNNLLNYSFESKDHELIDDVLKLYLETLDYLVYTDRYTFKFYPKPNVRHAESALSDEIVMWLQVPDASGYKNEDVLSSSQFLYLISSVIQSIAKISAVERSTTMQRFISEFAPVLESHLNRWVFGSDAMQETLVGPFQRRAWGCKHPAGSKQSGLTHDELLEAIGSNEMKSDADNLLCSAVTDTDLWIIATVSNVLYASELDVNSFSIDDELKNAFLAYLREGSELLKSKTTVSTVHDFSGKIKQVAGFDAGAWDSFSTYRNSECDYVEFVPELENDPNYSCAPAIDSAWDIGHARRFVHAFDSLLQASDVLDLVFPKVETMQQFSNAFAYRVFNGNFNKPLFNNFFNGKNGWYRVGYANQKGFGIGPSDLSSMALTGGYATWSPYSEDVKKVFSSLLGILESTDSEDIAHVERYYNQTHWKNYKRSTQYDFLAKDETATQLALLQFYSSLCQ